MAKIDPPFCYRLIYITNVVDVYFEFGLWQYGVPVNAGTHTGAVRGFDHALIGDRWGVDREASNRPPL